MLLCSGGSCVDAGGQQEPQRGSKTKGKKTFRKYLPHRSTFTSLGPHVLVLPNSTTRGTPGLLFQSVCGVGTVQYLFHLDATTISHEKYVYESVFFLILLVPAIFC